MIEQINKIAEIWWSWMWPMFWQVGVLIVLLGVVDLVIRKRVWPQVRYALWLLVLVKLVLPPTFSLSTSLTSQLQPLAEQVLMRQTGIGGIATVPNLERDLTTAKPLVNTSIEPSVISQETGKSDVLGSADREAGIVAPAGAVKPSRQAYAMLVWLLGTLILATWLVVKLRQLRGPHRGKAEEDALPPWFGKLLADTAEKLNLRRLPEVAFSETVVCPAVFGIFRPILLLPKGNITGFSRKDTEHILLHELAHIKRGDLWVHSVYMVLQVVYWFNPMLWFVRRQLRHLRELCCDATVGRILQEKTVDYRQTILENARRFLAKTVEPGMGLLGLFEDSNRLLNRLKWLEKKTWKYYRLRSATILAVVALMLACVLPMAKATKGEAAVAPGGIEVVEGTAKAVATKPQPRDGTTTGTTVSKLKWKPGVNAKSHKIYFGTQTNQLPLLAEVKSPSHDELPELEEGTRYYWLVNEVWADGTVITGDVWSFTTGKLVGWWKFDETEGRNAGDSSTNNNVGKLVGNPQWQPSAGKIGGALEFDGFDDYVDCGNDPSLDISKQITIAAWVKTNDAGNSQFNPYITKGDRTYGLKHHSRNTIEFLIYDEFWQVAHFPVDGSFNGVWHHLAGTYDGSKLKLYVDGKLEVANAYAGFIASSAANLNIARNSEARDRFYNGAIDDLRVYNYALSEKEIEKLCRVKAIKPHPSNDTTTGLTEMLELSWVPAIGAISNRVYGDIDPGELKLLGETKETHFSKLPGMHNMVYYWRVDGILADGSIAEGDVWSFWIPPRNAYNPFPVDGVEFVEQNLELSWVAGFGAKMHTVYIGDNFDDVSNASGGLPQIQGVYVVNNLELDKTYYWRVDEFDPPATHKGDVWSFKTLPEISVTDPNLVGWWKFDGNANDSSGNGNNGTEKGDPTYVAGKIGQAISFDGLSDRIEVHATFAGNPELFPAKAISVSAWVRSTVPASALCSLIRHEFHFTPLQTFADSAWATAFTNRYGSRVPRRTGSDWSKINDDKWHYYAVTYNNGIHEVWIDGTKEVSKNFGPFPLWTGDDQPWVFGGKERGEVGGEYYPGELDDVRIYNYALSKGEITTLHNEGK